MANKMVRFFEPRFSMEFKDLFALPLKLFDWIGLSLDKSVNYRYFFANCFVSILLFLGVLSATMDSTMDYELRFEAFAMLVTDFDILLKTFFLFWNKQKLTILYKELEKMFDVKHRNQRQVIASSKFVNTWIFTSLCAISLVLVIPFINTVYVLLDTDEFIGAVPILRHFPTNQFTYIPVLLCICCAVFSAMYDMLGNDSMTILMLAHISHQFRQVAEGFRDYSGGKEAMKELVDRHCAVFELVFSLTLII